MSLDPKTNSQARQAEKAKNRPEDEPLEPAFPFVRQYFDPFFFNLQTEPKKPAPSPFPEPLV